MSAIVRHAVILPQTTCLRYRTTTDTPPPPAAGGFARPAVGGRGGNATAYAGRRSRGRWRGCLRDAGPNHRPGGGAKLHGYLLKREQWRYVYARKFRKRRGLSVSWIDEQIPSAVGLHRITSEPNGDYNCIAWAADRSTQRQSKRREGNQGRRSGDEAGRA
jgi:hypothetical protein